MYSVFQWGLQPYKGSQRESQRPVHTGGSQLSLRTQPITLLGMHLKQEARPGDGMGGPKTQLALPHL